MFTVKSNTSCLQRPFLSIEQSYFLFTVVFFCQMFTTFCTFFSFCFPEACICLSCQLFTFWPFRLSCQLFTFGLFVFPVICQLFDFPVNCKPTGLFRLSYQMFSFILFCLSCHFFFFFRLSGHLFTFLCLSGHLFTFGPFVFPVTGLLLVFSSFLTVLTDKHRKGNLQKMITRDDKFT